MKKKQPTEKTPVEKKAAKTPTYYAYSVSEPRGEDGKSFWTRLGAYFQHEDGDGGTLYLDALPIGSRIVLRAPKADEA